ncbi:hypothetical protein [Bacillus thuringiensis]|uniref:Uncharacterized protein n=1 Tax=Bacillus thuringiensis T01-328 TaxID=1324966 RepID=A0AAN4HDH3_BACTU|nr:hypothetical protein [Bacillus thuringiensis]ERH97523.1 hypothetical protein BTCBT_006368 [Bacillus thuringiensis T01-328]
MNIQKRFQKAIKNNEKAMEELRNYTSNSEQVNKGVPPHAHQLKDRNSTVFH